MQRFYENLPNTYWVSSVELSLTLAELFLSPFLSGSQMPSVPCSWCWGSVLRYRSQQAGSCSSSPNHLHRWKAHIYCDAKKNKQKTILLGRRELHFAKYVFQWFMNFSDCFSLVLHFLLWLPVALRSCQPLLQLEEEPPSPILKSGSGRFLWKLV